ncbi:MAG TPA: CHASE2 domain-containing protein [Rhodocyclaceae bacterium]|nr:CHASE2 domain-containing protein [Rhodocyclaceae bacterium]
MTRFRRVPASVLREWLLLTVVLCVASGALALSQTLSPLDALWYDSIIARQILPVPHDLVLITIEPDTLDRHDLSRRTWNAGDSAELLARLTPGKPAAVLLDVAMAASDPRDPAGEEALSVAIRASGKVVLPISLQIERGSIQGFRLPIAKLANFTSALGHDKAISNPGGVMRRIPLIVTNGDISWEHVVLSILRTATGAVPSHLPTATPLKEVKGWHETQYLYLRFTGSERTFISYTARQVLNGEVPPTAIHGKLVLIGSKLADAAVAVPGSWRAERTMWGVEVLANAINTLRHDAWISVVPPLLGAGITIGLALVTLLSFLALPDRSAFAISVSAITLVALLDWALLSIGGIWFPFASFAATAALAYPLWAWRRLAATYRFVTLELDRMRAEPGVVGTTPPITHTGMDETANAPTLIDQQLGAIQEASAKLRVARKFVSDIVEGLPIGVIVIDADGRIVLANQPVVGIVCANQEQASADTLTGQELHVVLEGFSCVDGPDLSRTDWAVNHSREIRTPQGTPYWLACQQLVGDNDSRSGSVIALTDISELRETEAQREELLRFLSHDMRSPLASILALIELRKESAEQSNDNERFDEVKRYARHTLSLAEEFLQLAYATSSKPVAFDLIDLINAVELGVDLVRPLAHERHVKIDLQLPETAVIRGNHNLVGRMVANLVHNAVKFTSSDGSILISLSREEDEWLCRVSDNGEGIAPEDLPNVFQPYRRMLGDKRKGTGLGLSFVFVVVAKHGGKIDIYGEPGRGTEVTVRLPALECDGSRSRGDTADNTPGVTQ